MTRPIAAVKKNKKNSRIIFFSEVKFSTETGFELLKCFLQFWKILTTVDAKKAAGDIFSYDNYFTIEFLNT